jgi:hypothetical protein
VRPSANTIASSSNFKVDIGVRDFIAWRLIPDDQKSRISICFIQEVMAVSGTCREADACAGAAALGQKRLWVWPYPLVGVTPKSRRNGDQIAALVVCYGVGGYAVERLG